MISLQATEDVLSPSGRLYLKKGEVVELPPEEWNAEESEVYVLRPGKKRRVCAPRDSLELVSFGFWDAEHHGWIRDAEGAILQVMSLQRARSEVEGIANITVTKMGVGFSSPPTWDG
jgi:hypothetical protein